MTQNEIRSQCSTKLGLETLMDALNHRVLLFSGEYHPEGIRSTANRHLFNAGYCHKKLSFFFEGISDNNEETLYLEEEEDEPRILDEFAQFR